MQTSFSPGAAVAITRPRANPANPAPRRPAAAVTWTAAAPTARPAPANALTSSCKGCTTPNSQSRAARVRAWWRCGCGATWSHCKSTGVALPRQSPGLQHHMLAHGNGQRIARLQYQVLRVRCTGQPDPALGNAQHPRLTRLERQRPPGCQAPAPRCRAAVHRRLRAGLQWGNKGAGWHGRLLNERVVKGSSARIELAKGALRIGMGCKAQSAADRPRPQMHTARWFVQRVHRPASCARGPAQSNDNALPY